MNSFEKQPQNKIPESEPEHEVLSVDEKQNLGEAWVEMVVGKGAVPEKIQEMSDEELKEWLFVSLMEGVGDFIEKTGIVVDEYLIEKITSEEDIDKKSILELEYINNIREALNSFAQPFRSRGEVTTWNSCPSLMKETESFNCVGGIFVPVTGFYGALTSSAVSQFQVLYKEEVLKPWADIGVGDGQTGTGNFFKTTKWKGNQLLGCEEVFPILP